MDDSLFLFVALAMVGVMLFYSSRKRKKQAEQLRTEVVKGAQVMLTSGIYGKVTQVKEDRIVLETAPGQSLTVAIGAVRNIEAAPKPAANRKSKSVPEDK
jgi:preprotein translocase subunit YajC